MSLFYFLTSQNVIQYAQKLYSSFFSLLRVQYDRCRCNVYLGNIYELCSTYIYRCAFTISAVDVFRTPRSLAVHAIVL